MAAKSPTADGSTKKFLLKVIEMLGKGFKEKGNHNYTSDIELSRSAYKVVKTEVEYITVKAILNLPAIVESQNVTITLKEVLEFHQPVLTNIIKSHVSRLECMRAVEDCCLYCNHLNDREIICYVVHYLHEANILDGVSVLEFYEQMDERDSPLLRQNSFRVFIAWLQAEAEKKIVEDRNKLLDWSDDDDDRPLSHWLKIRIQQTKTVKPYCIWTSKPRKHPIKYKPVFVWVNKDGEEIEVEKQIQDDVLEVDAGNVSQEQNEEAEHNEETEQNKEGEQNEAEQNDEEQNGEADFEVDDLSDPDDLYNEDDDEVSENVVKNYKELSLEDLPLKYLFKRLTKNYMKGQARH